VLPEQYSPRIIQAQLPMDHKRD